MSMGHNLRVRRTQMKRDTRHCWNCGESLEEKGAVTTNCTATGHYTKDARYREDSHTPGSAQSCSNCGQEL